MVGHLDVIVGVQSEAVVNALRQHNHITLPAIDPDPPLIKVSHIKIACGTTEVMLSQGMHVGTSNLCTRAVRETIECFSFFMVLAHRCHLEQSGSPHLSVCAPQRRT